ncbi:hypothetical protein [Bordetella sp. LUAb4]|uniref:hypothetical protein n=1 Tax=Bordetella sp. LUAb4 TaxID=2843195 RepID=UPI001E45AF4C|nr:hypothetical protein [Bordetella sp. LUAb4]
MTISSPILMTRPSSLGRVESSADTASPPKTATVHISHARSSSSSRAVTPVCVAVPTPLQRSESERASEPIFAPLWAGGEGDVGADVPCTSAFIPGSTSFSVPDPEAQSSPDADHPSTPRGASTPGADSRSTSRSFSPTADKSPAKAILALLLKNRPQLSEEYLGELGAWAEAGGTNAWEGRAECARMQLCMKDTDVLFQRSNGTLLILAEYPWKVYDLFGIPRSETELGWPTVRDYERADLVLNAVCPQWGEGLSRNGPGPIPRVAYRTPETADRKGQGMPRVWEADDRVLEPPADTRPPLPRGFEWVSTATLASPMKGAGSASPAGEPGDVCAEASILKTQMPKLARGNSSLDDICYFAARRQ